MNFQFQQRTYKKQNGTQAIRLRIFTSANDIQYIDTGISVLKNQWDDKKQQVKKHPIEEQLNASMNALLNDVKILYYKNEGVSAKRLLQIYKNSKKYDGSSLLNFYQSIVDENKMKGAIRTAKTQQHYIDKLSKFASFLSFADISPLWAKDYEKWLISRGNKPNTIASNFKCLNAILNKAVKMGLIEKNPLKGYEIKTVNSKKNILSIEDINLLENYEIAPHFKGMELARDVFLFSFYMAGMRFSDVCKLKWEDVTDTEVVYTMGKSEKRAGATRYIPITPKVKQILERYKANKTFVFPILDKCDLNNIEKVEYTIYIANNKLNRSIKILAKHAGITKHVSMHIAKHSFASYAVKNNVNLFHISKLLGHTKLSTTEHYLRDFFQKEQTDVMNSLFGQ
jgi:phage integrase family protein|nr:MAG TPA: Integrase [Caudoviricetes sp.]